MTEKKDNIRDKIVEAMTRLLATDDAIAEIRDQAKEIRKEIMQDVEAMGFNKKAFRQILQEMKIQRSPRLKAEWLENLREKAKINVALHQPDLFEYARDAGVESFK